MYYFDTVDIFGGRLIQRDKIHLIIPSAQLEVNDIFTHGRIGFWVETQDTVFGRTIRQENNIGERDI